MNRTAWLQERRMKLVLRRQSNQSTMPRRRLSHCMSETNPKKRPRKPKHDLSDWLKLHDLSVENCRQLLSLSERYPDISTINTEDEPACKTEMVASQAWCLASDALSAALSPFRNTIEDVLRHTTTDFRVGVRTHQRPLTLHDGGNGYPYVRCGFRGRLADLINVQHEFSHAVQVFASRGKFLPPVLRECCAFVGELTLLDYLRHRHIEIYDDARLVWRSQSARIFCKHQPVLQAALQAPNTPYNYNWNYPIARILSIEICNQLNDRQKWKLFSGEIELNDLLELLDVI